jgi:hypothetical protein
MGYLVRMRARVHTYAVCRRDVECRSARIAHGVDGAMFCVHGSMYYFWVYYEGWQCMGAPESNNERTTFSWPRSTAQ